MLEKPVKRFRMQKNIGENVEVYNGSCWKIKEKLLEDTVSKAAHQLLCACTSLDVRMHNS